MSIRQFTLCAALLAAGRFTPLHSQTPAAPAPKPQPDVLIFTDGEKLVGQLKSAKGDSVVFKSDVAGEVTVAWSKIQELRTTHPFAVVGKKVKLARNADVAGVPQGTLTVTEQKIAVTPAAGAPTTVPVADTGFVVAEPEFVKATSGAPGFFANWLGTVTAGLSVVQATQDARTVTGAIALSRTEPSEAWLNPSDRTIFDASASYGDVTQPGEPEIKTEIYHADLEEDKYFSPRLFAFVRAAFDHNYALGLDFQQNYGGGIGWTPYKTPAAELDLRVGVTYTHENFYDSASNQNLVGSTLGEVYTHKLQHGIIFNEQISFTPAWNNPNAYFGSGSAGLTVPVNKRFSTSLLISDAFLNNPAPGFRKNSLSITAGLAYALK
jgi:hypothetical protein